MDSKKIYIFRHGQTDWNAESRFQGHTDIPLNAKGREQALELKALLQPLKPEVILSSDLSRARETAQIVADSQIPIVVTEALREARLGEPEGKLRSEIISHYGDEAWQTWLSIAPEHMDFAFPQGETKREQLARAAGFVTEYIKQNPHLKTLAISTHGGTLRRLIHQCEGASTEPIPIPNCCLFEVEFKLSSGRWVFKGAIGNVSRQEKLFK